MGVRDAAHNAAPSLRVPDISRVTSESEENARLVEGMDVRFSQLRGVRRTAAGEGAGSAITASRVVLRPFWWQPNRHDFRLQIELRGECSSMVSREPVERFFAVDGDVL